MPRTIDPRWIRLCCALTTFVPLVVFFTPALAFQIGYVWILCAMYLWPATGVASLIGLEAVGSGRPYVVYATGFTYEGRGPDGAHYLFIENSQTNDVYVCCKLNF